MSNSIEAINDLELPLEERIETINSLYAKNKELLTEVINSICSIYELFGTKSHRKYLYDICELSSIDSMSKSLCAKSLISYDNNDELAYKSISKVLSLFDMNIGTPYKLDFIKLLIQNPLYEKESISYLVDIVKNTTISSLYRLRIISGLFKKENENDENDQEIKQVNTENHIRECSMAFIQTVENEIPHRIQTGQFLLLQPSLNEKQKDTAESILLSFSKDENINYNARADSVDVLLRYGSHSSKEQAKNIISVLGNTGNKQAKTIYNNSQNVHTKDVEESVNKTLEYLNTLHSKEKISKEIIYIEIHKLLKEKKCTDKRILISLDRIETDKALYSKYHCTLENILIKLWTYIESHEHKDTLKERLLEELQEMAETCSSGFASRLVNVITGFGDYGITISWETQMFGNLSAKLNCLIKEMDNLKMQEKVLEQMTLETDKPEERKHFLKFLRTNMLEIRNQLYKEFKTCMTDTEFDMCFRTTVSMYEIGNLKI